VYICRLKVLDPPRTRPVGKIGGREEKELGFYRPTVQVLSQTSHPEDFMVETYRYMLYSCCLLFSLSLPLPVEALALDLTDFLFINEAMFD